MKLIAIVATISLAAACSTSAPEGGSNQSPASQVPTSSETTTRESGVHHIVVDPLLRELESNRHMVFDFDARFPSEARTARAKCASEAALAALSADRLAELGVTKNGDRITFGQLSQWEAESLAGALATCDMTRTIVRALLPLGSDPFFTTCIESGISKLDRWADLIAEMGPVSTVGKTSAVADLLGPCGDEELDRQFGPPPNDQMGEDLLAAASDIASVMADEPTIGERERACRPRALSGGIPKQWFERFTLAQLDSGVDVWEFLLLSTTESELDLIDTALGKAIRSCRPLIATANASYELDLSEHELLCLSSNPGAGYMRGYFFGSPERAEIVSLVEGLVDRCGPAGG